MSKQIFVSTRIGSDRCRHDEVALVYGQAHYSWKLMGSLYLESLRSLSLDIKELRFPETFQTREARVLAGCDFSSVHLIVKPIEHIRVLPNAQNLLVCGWEFPEFSCKDINGDPFSNQIRILKLGTQVLCWTSYTADNLRRMGVSATVLPPALIKSSNAHLSVGSGNLLSNITCLGLNFYSGSTVTEKIFPFHEFLASIKSDSNIFVTVLNPFDKRKNFKNLLNGFVKAADQLGNIFLIVKLVIDNVGTRLVNINQLLDVHYDLRIRSSNVIFIGEQLSDAEMYALYRCSKFYLCASSAEGLNLPLIEAMSVGATAVSTRNTAMGTYLDDENSICIDSSPEIAPTDINFFHGALTTTHFVADTDAVAVATVRAATLQSNDVAHLAVKGSERVSDMFGRERFARAFGDILRRLS